jgi:hypothetical protein
MDDYDEFFWGDGWMIRMGGIGVGMRGWMRSERIGRGDD